jgi:hypothetical protein
MSRVAIESLVGLKQRNWIAKAVATFNLCDDCNSEIQTKSKRINTRREAGKGGHRAGREKDGTAGGQPGKGRNFPRGDGPNVQTTAGAVSPVQRPKSREEQTQEKGTRAPAA